MLEILSLAELGLNFCVALFLGLAFFVLVLIFCLGDLSESSLRLVAVRAVLLVVLLVLASIGLPAEVQGVDGVDQEIVFVRGDVSVMGVVSGVGLSLVSLSEEGVDLGGFLYH